jgi:hypothetical protein
MSQLQKPSLRRLIAALTTVVFVLAMSCEHEKEIAPHKASPVPGDIVEKLQAAGFFTNTGLYKVDNGYLVEFDIFLTEQQIDEMAQEAKSSAGRINHYRSSHVVGGDCRTLSIYMSPTFNSGMQNAFDAGLARYNNVDLRLTFVRTSSSAAADISILPGTFPPDPDRPGVITLGKSASFPDENGNPGNKILLNDSYYNDPANQTDAITTITHEIGHAIGFRHTDYMNRFYSCLRYTGEEDQGNAVYIPNTPTGPSPDSWMLACTSYSDRPFTPEDIVALKTVFNSDLSVFDLSNFFDQSVALDYDGDHDDDLIFYRPGAKVFYLFEYRNGAYVVRLASGNGFLNYNLDSSADRIVSFDYNGDGKDDLLFYRPGKKTAYIMRSDGGGNFTNVYSSATGFFNYDLSSVNDRVIATDYNNDGYDDLVFYRPGNKIFYLFRSNGTTSFTNVVASGSGIGTYDLSDSRDKIVSLDYNGDGYDDLACYRPGSRIFYQLKSNGAGSYTRMISSSSGIASFDLSGTNDCLVRMNIDGDAYDDLAAYRPGSKVFYFNKSNGSSYTTTIASNNGVITYDLSSIHDQIISLDYNRDGKSDILCFRPGGGVRYYGRSTGSNFVREF